MTSLFLYPIKRQNMEKDLKDAYRLRYEYYNFYENKEHKWHERYKEHKLYKAVIESFEYDFKQIGKIMPKLIEEFRRSL